MAVLQFFIYLFLCAAQASTRPRNPYSGTDFSEFLPRDLWPLGSCHPGLRLSLNAQVVGLFWLCFRSLLTLMRTFTVVAG
jgi:hypothetical protein